MSNAETLNTVFIRLYRSLLQFSVECWPWASARNAAAESAVRAMAADELHLAERLYGWLNDHHVAVEMGAYPDNTALHFVSLSFLLQRIVRDHRELLQSLKETGQNLEGHGEAAALIAEVTAAVEKHLGRLTELAASTARTDVVVA